jgi:hypothetical protein
LAADQVSGGGLDQVGLSSIRSIVFDLCDPVLAATTYNEVDPTIECSRSAHDRKSIRHEYAADEVLKLSPG